MKVYIDRDACIGCDLCAQIAPDVFEMDDEQIATVAKQPDSITDEVQDAIDSCPTGAILVEN